MSIFHSPPSGGWCMASKARETLYIYIDCQVGTEPHVVHFIICPQKLK